MPNCFQLSRKSEPTKPVHFIDIDVEICKELDVPVDDHKYYLGWYDFVGLRLATGSSFDDMRKYLRELPQREPYQWDCWEARMAQIVEYLDANYVSAAWYESSSRRG